MNLYISYMDFGKMTITSIGTGDEAIWGYLEFGPSFFTSLGNYQIPIVDKIYNLDLSAYDRTAPLSTYHWVILWGAISYCPTIIGNVSRFKSALPKYDIGDMCITYRGHCTDAFFINYQSQRSGTYSSWSIDFDETYPSPYNPPSLVTSANQESLTRASSNAYVQADALQINLVNADISSYLLYINYQAALIDLENPAVFGDF
jgi:hypothetical protein